MTEPAHETQGLVEDVDLLHGTLDDAKTDASHLGEIPADVDTSTLNPAKLKKAMTDCWAEPIQSVKKMVKDGKATAGKAAAGKVDKDGAKAQGKGALKKGKKVFAQFRDCAMRRKDKAVALKELAPGGKSDFVKAKLDLVDHLRKSIAFLELQSHDLPDMLKRLAELKARNEAAHAAAQKSPLNGAAEKKANEAEYKKLDKQIDTLTATLKNDLSHLPGDLVSLGSKVKNDLTSFGK